MSDRVGRNDPCPCGSGAKYKHCCLRDQKRREPASSGDWRRQYETEIERLSETSAASLGEAARERFERVSRAWSILERNLAGDVDDLSAVEDALHDGAPNPEGVLREGLDAVKPGLPRDEDLARRGADWTGRVLSTLPDLHESLRRELTVIRAECLQEAERWRELESVARDVIDDEPDEARGYALLADALVAKPSPEPKEAVDILESAFERDVRGIPSWDLQAKLGVARAKAAKSESAPTESDDLEDVDVVERREAFWNEYSEKSLDEKFDMIRRAMDDEQMFDARMAFTSFIEELLLPAREHARGEDWVELAEHLRERRPGIAREESGPIGIHELEFRLWSGDDSLDDSLQLLFSTPSDNSAEIRDAVHTLAYRGELVRAAERLERNWEEISGTFGAKGPLMHSWAGWVVCANVVRWSEQNIDEPRPAEEIAAKVGEPAETMERGALRSYGETFLGDGKPLETLVDADRPETDAEALRAALAFARHLVDDHDWPPSRALLAVPSMRTLFREAGSSRPADRSPYSTPRASEVSKLRSRLDDEHWLLPDPDLVDGIAEETASQTMTGTPRPAAAFLEAVSHLPNCIDTAGAVESGRVKGSVEYHLRDRLEEIAGRLTSRMSGASLARDNLEAALERLR